MDWGVIMLNKSKKVRRTTAALALAFGLVGAAWVTQAPASQAHVCVSVKLFATSTTWSSPPQQCELPAPGGHACPGFDGNPTVFVMVCVPLAAPTTTAVG